MNITKISSKTVAQADGSKLKRKGIVNFAIPEVNDTENGIAVFGNEANLVAFANYGLWRFIQLQVSNDLMKGDKAQKALKKMVAALKSVMPNLTDEAATSIVMSNPEVAASFTSEPLTAEVQFTFDPSKLTAPSILDEADETEEDEAAA